MSLNNGYAIGQGSNEVMHVLHPRLRYPDLWRGCVGAWAPCLGPAWSILHDNSMHKNQGTLTNMDPATDWVVSGGAGALDFDGTDDLVTAHAVAKHIGVRNFSYSAWVKSDNAGVSSRIMYLGDTPSSNDAYLHIGNNTSGGTYGAAGKFGLSLYTGSAFQSANSTTTVVSNVWYHVTATFSITTGMAIYVNGKLEGTNSNKTRGGTQSIQFNIGQHKDRNINWFNGVMDDLRVYNRDLIPLEINLLSTRRGIAYETTTRRSAYNSPAAPPAGNRYSLFRPSVFRASR